MRHLVGIEGLGLAELESYLHNAEQMVEVLGRDIKKVPPLRGKTVVNFFLEPSTRTRASFEIAGKWLSADVINMGGGDSSITKGETLYDTIRTLQAMSPDVLVIRHKESGAAHFCAKHLERTAVVNAGDGMHEHPTQALLDLLTLRQHFAKRNRDLHGLTVAIVGDIRHSRVARSNMFAHALLGNKVRLVGPASLVPRELEGIVPGTVEIRHTLREGLEGADVVMVLRMQLERMTEHFVPTLDEYSRDYCVSEASLKVAKPDCIVLHPGPMNRGTEISTKLADGARSLIERQVNNGLAVRMAVLLDLAMQEKAMQEKTPGGAAAGVSIGGSDAAR